MLKTRIIGVLVVRNGVVVQSIGFKNYLPVGRPSIAVEYLNKWGIDEIALSDISATPNGNSPDYQKLKEYSKYCHVPLSVGGGIKKLQDIEKLIRSGADKVIINSAFYENPQLVTEGSEEFGDQCIIVSLDAHKENGKYEVFTESGENPTGKTPAELAKLAEDCGAGEILLNSIDHDGMKDGYDLALLETVRDAVNIPVIICGGAGCPQHLFDAIKRKVSAVAAANFFHFTEHSVILAKTFLTMKNSNVRLDTYAEYQENQIGPDGRVIKMDDKILEKLRFEYVPEEII